MDDKHPIETMIHNSVDYLIRKNTNESWGEAIAVIIGNLKNQDGLFLSPRLTDDYTEHMRLCVVLASALRMYIDSNILCAIPKNMGKKEWQGLTDEDIDELEGLHIRAAIGAIDAWVVGVEDFARAIEAKLKEKNHGR